MIKLGLSWDLFRKFLAMLNRFKPSKDDHLVNRLREALAAINLCGFRSRSGSPDAFTPTTPTASTSIAFGSLWAMLNRYGLPATFKPRRLLGHALHVNVARFKFAAVNAVRFAMLNPFKDDHARLAMHVLRSALATMIKLALSWDLIRKFFAMLNRFNEACRVYVALPLHVYVARLLFVFARHLVGLHCASAPAMPCLRQSLALCEAGSLRVEGCSPPVVAVRRDSGAWRPCLLVVGAAVGVLEKVLECGHRRRDCNGFRSRSPGILTPGILTASSSLAFEFSALRLCHRVAFECGCRRFNLGENST